MKKNKIFLKFKTNDKQYFSIPWVSSNGEKRTHKNERSEKMLFISAVLSAHKIEMIYKLNFCISYITCLQAIVKVNELITYFMLTFNISITYDQNY